MTPQDESFKKLQQWNDRGFWPAAIVTSGVLAILWIVVWAKGIYAYIKVDILVITSFVFWFVLFMTLVWLWSEIGYKKFINKP